MVFIHGLFHSSNNQQCSTHIYKSTPPLPHLFNRTASLLLVGPTIRPPDCRTPPAAYLISATCLSCISSLVSSSSQYPVALMKTAPMTMTQGLLSFPAPNLRDVVPGRQLQFATNSVGQLRGKALAVSCSLLSSPIRQPSIATCKFLRDRTERLHSFSSRLSSSASDSDSSVQTETADGSVRISGQLKHSSVSVFGPLCECQGNRHEV